LREPLVKSGLGVMPKPGFGSDGAQRTNVMNPNVFVIAPIAPFWLNPMRRGSPPTLNAWLSR
jgi:hypothetical protein